MKQPKVLIMDIETAPMLAYVWGLKDQNIGLNQLKSDWYVLAWAAKWLGEKKVHYMDLSKTPDQPVDLRLLYGIWQLLNEADVVITQFGSGFDGPRLNARFIMNGLQPPKPYRHLDTYRIAKRVADFTSNKLEYLTEKLCTKYKKLSHKKFPGMNLWTECLKGNKQAWAEMKKYNIHDVLSTEELYLKLQKWTPVSMPSVHHLCPARFAVAWGSRPYKGSLYKRMYCKKCKEYFKGDKIDG
jgi:hypothetical protein